jgi:ankyrin repeat protein
MVAAGNGGAECLAVLLKLGGGDNPNEDAEARVNRWGHDETNAHFAARFGHERCLEVMSHATGCRLDAQNVFGRSSVHHAALHGHCTALKTLRVAGVDMNVLDHAGYSALTVAAAAGHANCVIVLLAGVAKGAAQVARNELANTPSGAKGERTRKCLHLLTEFIDS